MSTPELRIALALVWRDGRLLITRRREGAHLGGYWELPGGKIEPGETPEQAAVRETIEEVGVTASPLRRRPAIRYEYADRAVTLLPVDCDWQAGEAQPLGVSEWRWAAREELAEFRFPPANKSLLAELIAGR